MVAFRSSLLAALLFATSAIAQDNAAPADGVASDEGGSSGWNTTYFLSPSRGQEDYWVNGVENTAFWNPIPQPTYLTISNGNLTSFNGTKTLGEQIPGGTGSFKVQIDDYPVGTNYVLALLEQGTQRKLAQSQGFWIKIKGTQPASAAGAQGAASAPAAGAGGSSTPTDGGNANGGASASPAASGAAAGASGGAAPSSAASAPAAGAMAVQIPGVLALAAGAVAALAL